MAVIITGGSGFIGTALTDRMLEAGHRVYSLSRHPPEAREGIVPLKGDITKPNLGLEDVPGDITRCYHLAGIHSLRIKDKGSDGSIFEMNVEGTRNVLAFCSRYGIPHLLFASTAYTWGMNPYGNSKILNENDIEGWAAEQGKKVTIFKPSIVMGTPQKPYPGHFLKFVNGVIAIHKRAELVRRKIEGVLRLPVIEPVFRIQGNPDGLLNLVAIDAVADSMADISREGTFWLTNPAPPTLEQLSGWIGEFIMLDMKFIQDEFKSTPIEAAFDKLVTPFKPYLNGHQFPSSLDDHPPIDKEFIQETIRQTILRAS